MAELITIEGHIDKVEMRRDQSIKLTLASTEGITDPETLTRLFSINKNPVSIGMKVGEMTNNEYPDIPEPKKNYEDEKTPSQRMRGVLYRWWEAKGKPEDFDLFYRRSMENLIDQIKEKL